mmetsp:Transcript_85226/g.275965  ORF Transcript_85226/g.275965 Transcript_85226/m.275965 type:complete len:210 (-) Transcript_85226:449-1078(-)
MSAMGASLLCGAGPLCMLQAAAPPPSVRAPRRAEASRMRICCYRGATALEASAAAPREKRPENMRRHAACGAPGTRAPSGVGRNPSSVGPTRRLVMPAPGTPARRAVMGNAPDAPLGPCGGGQGSPGRPWWEPQLGEQAAVPQSAGPSRPGAAARRSGAAGAGAGNVPQQPQHPLVRAGLVLLRRGLQGRMLGGVALVGVRALLQQHAH